jgi:hypothetical protein
LDQMYIQMKKKKLDVVGLFFPLHVDVVL